MSEKAEIKSKDWIRIGADLDSAKDAVVCNVYENRELGEIEVVYIDDRNRAINEDVIWKEGHWVFKQPGPCGGYADNNPRLTEFVARLRRGRFR